MTTLADRVLEKLNDRKMSLMELGAELRMKPSDVARTLRGTLEDLHRHKRVMIVGNEWTVTKRNSASDGTNFEKPKPELTDFESRETDANARAKGDAPKPRRTPPKMSKEGIRQADKERQQILMLLANGPMKTEPIHEALGGAISFKTVQNRLTRLKLRGQIIRVKAGFALPSATVADELEVKATAPPVATAVQAAHNVVLTNGATNEGPKIDIAIAPVCDIRAKLMEMADFVRDGKLNHDQVVDMLEILQYAAGIDQMAESVG